MTVYGNGTLHIYQARRADAGTNFCDGTGPDSIEQTFTTELKLASMLHT